jgi:hypothetical protein
MVIQQNVAPIRDFLEPLQLGLSEAGPAKIVMSIAQVLKFQPKGCAVVVDTKNAFNTMRRALVLRVLEGESSLSLLAQFAGIILSPMFRLESGKVMWGEAAKGMVQGDPVSQAFFNIGVQPVLVQLDAKCEVGGGLARAGHNNMVAVDPLEVVISALRHLEENLRDQCRMVLQRKKAVIYQGPACHLPSEVQLCMCANVVQCQCIELACARAGEVEVAGRRLRGFVLYILCVPHVAGQGAGVRGGC